MERWRDEGRHWRSSPRRRWPIDRVWFTSDALLKHVGRDGDVTREQEKKDLHRNDRELISRRRCIA
jgi:hypothetical protein